MEKNTHCVKTHQDRNHFHEYIKAAQENLKVREMKRLSKHKNHAVRARIAEHTSTPDELLFEFCRDEHEEVRIALAARKHIPESILKILMDDTSPEVRFELAENPHVPTSTLETLSQDSNPFVAERAWLTLRNKKTTFRQMSCQMEERHQVKVFTGGSGMQMKILDIVASLLPNFEQMLDKLEIQEYDIHDLDYLTEARRYGISAIPAVVVDGRLACR